jgi:hypothetical protein
LPAAVTSVAGSEQDGVAGGVPDVDGLDGGVDAGGVWLVVGGVVGVVVVGGVVGIVVGGVGGVSGGKTTGGTACASSTTGPGAAPVLHSFGLTKKLCVPIWSSPPLSAKPLPCT